MVDVVKKTSDIITGLEAGPEALSKYFSSGLSCSGCEEQADIVARIQA